MNYGWKKSICATGAAAIGGILLAGCNGETSGEAGGGEGGTHELTISHFLPSHHLVHDEILADFTAELEEQTDGRITSEIYSAGALGEPGSQYDMAVTGTADLAISVHGFTPGRFPLVSIVELPFLTESAENGSQIIQKLYEEFDEFQDEHEDTTPLWLFTAEPAQFISAEHRIETPEDLNGLRVRSPSPLATDIIEALGGTPVSMPMGEVYESLQRGVVDAAMVPFSAVYDYNFYDVIDYITVGHFSMTPFFSTMNTTTYESLSDSDQELIDSISGGEMAAKSGEVFDRTGDIAIDSSEEAGITFIHLDEEGMAPWEEALDPIVEQWIASMEEQGYPGREIYERALELGEELN
ncbi:TRAP transporter substrate-binding protein [Alteribacter natronophilus]|uniref:TRAP transporter substrate-binding protein n=1 Tax=Alteribacter natronophilus TaxID=2583810 RepID=UPI00110EFA8E|nr:TRAP transporter substrate-binding protein [Alteribacter natronophilus]TMW72314.1 TRAP transporter substrate-binding protein [Alteribacter natronophilus]